ncbi:hypothetical protein POTOM_046159 [Populus tomentosa]|uniref:DUF4220 domain-containing protein n=1 Tax=Populus tomentosa TaxID=118781 RepID=A0A8X7YE07_POPTO|nr:hypothetical protein POTOM_046159 [Populus tomentosa]
MWCAYLMADWVATVALGVLLNNLGEVTKDMGRRRALNADTELAAFWAPFLILYLGKVDVSNTGGSSVRDTTELIQAHYLFTTFDRLFVELILSFQDRDNSQNLFKYMSSENAFKVFEIELGFILILYWTDLYLTKRPKTRKAIAPFQRRKHLRWSNSLAQHSLLSFCLKSMSNGAVSDIPCDLTFVLCPLLPCWNLNVIPFEGKGSPSSNLVTLQIKIRQFLVCDGTVFILGEGREEAQSQEKKRREGKGPTERKRREGEKER